MTVQRVVLLDAAGTVLTKPDLLPTMLAVMTEAGLTIGAQDLARRHKLLSEVVESPDHTGADFYRLFNSHLLRLLGVPACGEGEQLADRLYERCRALPWKLADGADHALDQLRADGCRIGIVSNWGSGLPDLLAHLGLGHLDPVVVSSGVGWRKPDTRLLADALRRAGAAPGAVVAVGDSVRLDIEPAVSLGVGTVLYDPLGLFVDHPGQRIEHFAALAATVQTHEYGSG